MAQHKVCPQCGKIMALRDGKRGKFWGCTGYPVCRKTLDHVEQQPEGGSEDKKTLSSYQQAVVDAIRDPAGGNLVIEAVAGSGKTFIIVHCLRYTRGQVVFLAFNKAIAMNLRRKAPEHVNCSTIHSLGKSAIDATFPHRPIVDDKKKMGIVKELFPEEKDTMLRLGLVALASKCQNTLTDPQDVAAVMRLIDRYDIDFEHVGANGDSEERAIATLPTLLRECMTRTGVIDFDDMIWLPIVLNIPIPQHDWVFVDEAQDLNAANMEMILRARKPTGRVVVVGDRNQSIYGFRGADTNAIPRLIEGLNAKVLPLSITYRCPVSHVKMARTLVPQLEPTEWAEEGEIAENLPQHHAIPTMVDGDLVLCRTNAPLVATCYAIIRLGRKATIQGRDIGQGLIQIIDKMKATDINDLLGKIADYRWREREKMTRAGKEHRIQALEDKCETLVALTDGINNLSELRARIEMIFTDDVSGIVLSTVHRAKGLESDHTFILRPDLMPFPKARSEEDIQQELNILYVALTRAKKRMSFIEGSAPCVDPAQIRDLVWKMDLEDGR